MINIIIPCAGSGTRLNLPYSKEIHKINHKNTLIDLSLSLCLKNKEIINEIIIVTRPDKKDLIEYMSKWKKEFKIRICFFNNNYFEWAGSIRSAEKNFANKNVVLLPDTKITQYKDKSLLKQMNTKLNCSEVCFALKKEKDKKKLSNLGALAIEDNKIIEFCDKPQSNLRKFNCHWGSFGFTKNVSIKLLEMMTKSIKRKKVNINKQNFSTSFFYIKKYIDLGTWENIENNAKDLKTLK